VRPRLDSDLRRTAWRIGVQTAVLVIVCLAAVGALVYATVVRSQQQQTTQALTTAAAAADMGGRDGDHDGDQGGDPGRDQGSAASRAGSVSTAVLRDGQLRSSALMPTGLPDRAVMIMVGATGISDRRTVELRTGPYDVLTVRRGDIVVQAAANLFEQHQERENILGALGIGGAVGVVLSAVLGALLAHRAVQPMATALALQRRFVADAGHELRTPLTLLSTRAQLLRRRLHTNGEPAGRDLTLRDADGIVDDTRALTDILEELLLAADTRTPVPQEPVDVTAIVTDAVSAAQAAAEASRITLTLAAGSTMSLTAGAPTALKRAVTALIDNALSHAEHQVEVHVEARGSQLAIEVVDDGPGIAETTLPRMFHRFSSDRDQSTETARHYGLGLSLVSEIATRHGGSVRASNRTPPDHGAVLTVLIPR
jgi:two-component system OmpR family sensor kinase